jgi:glucose dehydrogenase
MRATPKDHLTFLSTNFSEQRSTNMSESNMARLQRPARFYGLSARLRLTLRGSLVPMIVAIGLCACGAKPPPVAAPATPAPPRPSAGSLDAARLAHASDEPDQWFTSGRDGAGTYYSPLRDINADNVARLGFAWQYHLGTRRGLEATPIVIDGVMYAVGNFGRVYVVDAASGRELWTYDPQVDGQWGRYACCDAVNRGLAVWKGRVYVGALDARPRARS